MPRREFRTIEAVVQLVEGWKSNADKSMSGYRQGQAAHSYWHARSLACEDFLDILRSSNLGIVYPPAEQGDKS